MSLPSHIDRIVGVKQGIPIPIRIFPSSTVSQKPKPYLIYIHGGAFIVGHHHIPHLWIFAAFLQDYHIVSISYRKCPQASMPDAIDDVLDSVIWTKENLGKITQTDVDLDRYVVVGDSAGGGHAIVAAARMTPPPKAIVDIYGVADMLDPAFNLRPRPNDIDDDTELIEGYSIQQIRAGISRDSSQAITSSPYDMSLSAAEVQAAWDDGSFEYTEQRKLQWAIKKYADKYKLYTWLCFRREEFEDGSEGEREFEAHVRRFNAIDVIRESETYPPTFVLQGTGDTRVPASVSERLVQVIRSKGFEVGVCYEPGGEHGYDSKYEVGHLLRT